MNGAFIHGQYALQYLWQIKMQKLTMIRSTATYRLLKFIYMRLSKFQSKENIILLKKVTTWKTESKQWSQSFITQRKLRHRKHCTLALFGRCHINWSKLATYWFYSVEFTGWNTINIPRRLHQAIWCCRSRFKKCTTLTKPLHFSIQRWDWRFASCTSSVRKWRHLSSLWRIRVISMRWNWRKQCNMARECS